MGTEQINIIIHNTIYVPGHFHATVVIGTTLAFMSLTYFLIPTLFRKQVAFPGIAKLQPYFFGIGMSVFVLAMMGAGTLGVERRHWDMAFTNSTLAFEYPASAYTMMGIMGIAGVLAILGGAMYILVTVTSVFFGKPVGSESSYGFTTTRASRAEPVVIPEGGHAATGKWGFAAPGTFLLGRCSSWSFLSCTTRLTGSIWRRSGRYRSPLCGSHRGLVARAGFTPARFFGPQRL